MYKVRNSDFTIVTRGKNMVQRVQQYKCLINICDRYVFSVYWLYPRIEKVVERLKQK